MDDWSSEQLEAFERDGFVVVPEGFIDDETVAELRERFEPLFAGRYDTGIRPDEVNWVPGRDPEDRTRQICNGWKADTRDRRADVVRADRSSCRAVDGLGRGTPPSGQRDLEAARDEVARDAPGRELPRLPRSGGDDHVLDRARRHERRVRHRSPTPPARTAGRARRRTAASSTPRPTGSRRSSGRGRRHEEQRLVPVVVRAGGAAFHHFNTFHGSGPNTASVRPACRDLTPRAGPSARFHPEHTDPVYSRYRRVGDLSLDESFFPIVWTRDGYRTPWLDAAAAVA